MIKNHDILLVEDNPDDELLTLRALRQINIKNNIVVARDGAEALDYLFAKNDSGQYANILPQLVLLDLKLPKVDGLEVLQKIRNTPRTQYQSVTILTSSKEEQDIVNSYKLGANSYVVKPVDTPQFMDAVKQLGIYWLLINKNSSPELERSTCE
ncbi:MAG: response regulator [Proteobacteria bacterium]|nr:response regulator [Pseudomonadota bacterium]